MIKTAVWKPAAMAAILLAASGCSTFHHKKKDAELSPEASFTQLGVNAWLWRASLDTLKFMPLQDVDSQGGVIITDWYVNPDAANERLKVRVTISDQRLRADALRVDVSRQEMTGGAWVDAPVRAGTAMKIEDAILQRAREMRIAQLGE